MELVYNRPFLVGGSWLFFLIVLFSNSFKWKITHYFCLPQKDSETSKIQQLFPMQYCLDFPVGGVLKALVLIQSTKLGFFVALVTCGASQFSFSKGHWRNWPPLEPCWRLKLESQAHRENGRRRQEVCNSVVILSVLGKMWLLREFSKACAINIRVKIVSMSLN